MVDPVEYYASLFSFLKKTGKNRGKFGSMLLSATGFGGIDFYRLNIYVANARSKVSSNSSGLEYINFGHVGRWLEG